MINAIIFDFGDVFINLNKVGLQQALMNLGIKNWNENLEHLNHSFEIGKINENQFLMGLSNESAINDLNLIKKAWNTVLSDFPNERLLFLKGLKANFKLFLLSNTDAIHIQFFEDNYGEEFVREFYDCFDTIYFSFQLGLRKPDVAIFKRVISEQNLNPKNTLFVDDRKENTDAAQSLQLNTWNLKPGEEDVTDLLSLKILNQ